MDKRIIHTKLYSAYAKEILASVEGQLSDGMWENSLAMEKYWRFLNVTTAPDGEVLIQISKDRFDERFVHNGFANMNDVEVLKWFAAKVKQIMKAELKDNDSKDDWKRDNDSFETDYLSDTENITVSDVYFIYEFLLGRNTAGKYELAQCQKLEGKPRDEAATLAEITKREKLAKLDAEYAANRKLLNEQKKEMLNSIVALFETKYNELNAKYKAECAAI